MLHHEESPEKPQYNVATPPFLGKLLPILPNPPFSSKHFQTPPISINFEKVGGGAESKLCNGISASILYIDFTLKPVYLLHAIVLT